MTATRTLRRSLSDCDTNICNWLSLEISRSRVVRAITMANIKLPMPAAGRLRAAKCAPRYVLTSFAAVARASVRAKELGELGRTAGRPNLPTEKTAARSRAGHQAIGKHNSRATRSAWH